MPNYNSDAKAGSFEVRLSKETIRRLSDYFKLSKEAFNRPYKLINEVNRHFRNACFVFFIHSKITH